MFSDLHPEFNRGRILKREMLENLRDYPRNFVDIWFNNYSNGIISGTGVLVKDNHLTVTKGIIKHAGRIYMLDRDHNIPYSNTGREVLLKVKFLDMASNNDFKCYHTEILIDEDTGIKKNELELGRFKLKEGAKLRSDYRGFADLSTEYNTVNIINVEYSGIGKSTVSPLVLGYFSAEILKSGSANPYDIAFAMQCMSQGTVNRELILHYISNRLKSEYREYTNLQIYKNLLRIAGETGKNVIAKPEFRHGGSQRILVD